MVELKDCGLKKAGRGAQHRIDVEAAKGKGRHFGFDNSDHSQADDAGAMMGVRREAGCIVRP